MAEGDAPHTAPEGSWQFKADDDQAVSTAVRDDLVEVLPRATAIPPTGPEGSITWTASEFIAHQKTPLWYLSLGVAAAVLAVIVWLLTKDVVSPAVIIIGALLLAIYGARQPRQIQYRLDQKGIHVGSRQYAYQEFRSFSIIPEGAFNSIVLTPLKRFSLLLTIYYAPEDEQKIVALLSERLPMEPRRKDAIDRLMWRIRF